MYSVRSRVGIVFMLGFIILSCSSPPENDIIQAVRRSLEKRVPIRLARHLTGGQNAYVEEIRVLQVSKALGEGDNKYWQVKIYARGICRVMFGGRKSFEGEARYRVYKDEFETWQAVPLRR